MEVVNSKGAVLSNCEVFTLLQDLCQQGSKGRRNLAKTQTHLANIAYDTLKYLEKTPCRNQTPEIIQRFLQSVKEFKLTKAEKLQLINLRPTTPVEMQLIIEESEDRLTEEQVEELISLVELHFSDNNAGTHQMVNGAPGQ
ncbi:DNA-directed RNA polymerase III subunit RPC9-like [Homarus americanus]|uniref:DNA-directed RNA polymerase III subunit RPC9 n=1 Tax=Homarus americanus TaxID=6706 RepID=A0A8J5K8I6_HOMAM|nr:DNA-directed RNA polymerase III subunit RPC9-like [Homarus americanus]XP_042221061.1 DNA-directed RNA polymerase III subunit RPC9-like [Homarus americanus]XP_042221062.1 DNA-directed RNA polymerase III subunit RPC9-like [Homarus americanus]XP_042221063.1 DNA-directed RNA polymerase III subunit RPC9-like [Homarus americanus]XP_042221064.1 DNA-directed RNA polymerase III subunit RPC9-like [Homarus americanus]KAG7169593.1 DNA-directed RNA polymerase III subunit RPC9-like [Homarus americanus]